MQWELSNIYLYPENLFLQFNIFSYFALHSFAYYSFYVGKGIPELKKNCPIMFAVNFGPVGSKYDDNKPNFTPSLFANALHNCHISGAAANSWIVESAP